MSLVCDPTDNQCGIANGDSALHAYERPGGVPLQLLQHQRRLRPAGSCNVDSDCATGNWCNETAHVCTPQLANGVTVPTDGAHMAPEPILNGTCTTAAGALVCQSGVCDPTDNKCGIANGDGTCNTTNGGTVCRSATCGTTGVCILAYGCAVGR